MPSSPPAVFRLLEGYFRFLLLIPVLTLVAMMLTTVADVFMRYVFNAPVRGSYDIVEICLLISIYFALPAVLLEGRPILIDLIDGFAAPGLVRVLKSVAAFGTVAALCFVFWSMLKPAMDAYDYGDVKLELNLPVWIIWIIALFGVLNSILASLMVLFASFPAKTGHVNGKGPL